MPTTYKPTETYQVLKRLSKKVPGSKYLLPSLPEEVEGGREPLSVVSGAGTMGPAMVKQEAAKEIIKTIFNNPKVASNLRSHFSDLLRVVGATPKRAISSLKEFTVNPGRNMTGRWNPEFINLLPSYDEQIASMGATLAHEVGHGASIPMLGKLIKRYKKGYKGDPTPIGYDAAQEVLPEIEGVAEYLGKNIQKKAGVKPEVMFGYGPSQEKVFNQLEKMPSRNPYMNVYRYLQGLMKE